MISCEGHARVWGATQGRVDPGLRLQMRVRASGLPGGGGGVSGGAAAPREEGDWGGLWKDSGCRREAATVWMEVGLRG